jgi:excisionase family DNA binding protein
MTASKQPIPRVCVFCQKVFEARKTTTSYCSLDCARKAYKERQRMSKLNVAKEEFREKISEPIYALQSRDYLSVCEAAMVLGISRWTIQRAIKQGKIVTLKLLGRRIIPHSAIQQLINYK